MFEELQPYKKLMTEFPAPWGIAGGWAIDLFLSKVTREHSDVAIAIFRRDQRKLEVLFTSYYFKYVLGTRTIKWHGENLELPVHELQAHSMDGQQPDLEVLLNETDPMGMRWMFRRNPFVNLNANKVFLRNELDIPFLTSEIVLLFRAKEHRDADDPDLAHVLPALSHESKLWLLDALKNTHPGHPWIPILE